MGEEIRRHPSSFAAPPDPSGEGVPPVDQPGGPRAVEHPIPRTGDQPLLVVLVDFSDQLGLFGGEDWRQFFFGSGGFTDYFTENSYNQLRYSGDVVGIEAGTAVVNSSSVAYIRLANPISFYADDLYGFKVGPGQFPRNHGGVVYHALEALDSAGFDFSPYSNPTTNQVENLVVVFAGSNYGYTRDASGSLEATAYRLIWSAEKTFVSSGGEEFDNYTFCPDQLGSPTGTIARIGICAHEHGHALGLPDLYDFSYTTTGAGYFDLMAYGTFGASGGDRPFHLGAFSKEFLGWVNPEIPPRGTTTQSLAPLETDGAVIKLYPNGDNQSSEYFLLENRQPLGFDADWSGVGLCPGLVIWHVDQTIVSGYIYSVNTLPSAGGPPHQGAIVVEADGGFDMISPPLNHGECSDTWSLGQEWKAGTPPGTSLWDGSLSNLQVEVLNEVGGELELAITVGSTFIDVSVSHWAWQWIETIFHAGLTAGYPDGTYRPDNPVTRAEMAVFLKKGIHGSTYTPPILDGSHPFSDISGHWAEAWIEDLFDEGFTSGFPDGTYRPDNQVTRAEMAVFLKKAIHGSAYTSPAPDGSHPFSDITGHWAEAWIEDLFDEGITSGFPDGTYRPENTATRAEMAVFLVNAFNFPLP